MKTKINNYKKSKLHSIFIQPPTFHTVHIPIPSMILYNQIIVFSSILTDCNGKKWKNIISRPDLNPLLGKAFGRAACRLRLNNDIKCLPEALS